MPPDTAKRPAIAALIVAAFGITGLRPSDDDDQPADTLDSPEPTTDLEHD